MSDRDVDDDDQAERDWDEDDFDEATDQDEPTIACPYCRKEIHEDSQQCPYCQRYISAEDASRRPKSWLIIIGAALCLYVVYRWIVG